MKDVTVSIGSAAVQGRVKGAEINQDTVELKLCSLCRLYPANAYYMWRATVTNLLTNIHKNAQMDQLKPRVISGLLSRYRRLGADNAAIRSIEQTVRMRPDRTTEIKEGLLSDEFRADHRVWYISMRKYIETIQLVQENLSDFRYWERSALVRLVHPSTLKAVLEMNLRDARNAVVLCRNGAVVRLFEPEPKEEQAPAPDKAGAEEPLVLDPETTSLDTHKAAGALDLTVTYTGRVLMDMMPNQLAAAIVLLNTFGRIRPGYSCESHGNVLVITTAQEAASGVSQADVALVMQSISHELSELNDNMKGAPIA